jgi:hypothetical protein
MRKQCGAVSAVKVAWHGMRRKSDCARLTEKEWKEAVVVCTKHYPDGPRNPQEQGFSNFPTRGAAFTLSYRLAGSKVINCDSLLKCHGNCGITGSRVCRSEDDILVRCSLLEVDRRLLPHFQGDSP